MFYYHSLGAVWQNGFAGLVEVKRNSKEVNLAMRVVFLEDVAGVARGGDVKEVKNGFARNYLIPKSLAVPATHNALQRVEKLSRSAGVNRIKLLDDMKQLAEAIEGT
jgi:ribosomal protein L9